MRVVALGCVIRGDTAHFDFVAGECARGLQQAMLSTGVPVAFGVLTTETVAQAQERSAPGCEQQGRGSAADRAGHGAFAARSVVARTVYGW